MSVSADTLRRLAALKLPSEAMSEVLSIIADVQAADDARKEKDRIRKRNVRGMSAECPVEKSQINDATPPLKMSPHTPLENTPPSSELSLRSSSAADAAICESPMDEDPKDVLFRDGLRWLAKETGKSENSLRSSIGKMLKLAGGDANAGLVLGVLRDAKRERKADPVAWALGVLSGRANARAGPQVERDYGKGALAELIRNVDERLRNEPDGRVEGEISRGNVLSLPVVQGVQAGGRDDDGDVSPFAQWLRPGSG